MSDLQVNLTCRPTAASLDPQGRTTTQAFDAAPHGFEACQADDRAWHAELDAMPGSEDDGDEPLFWLAQDSVASGLATGSVFVSERPTVDIASCHSPYGGSSSDHERRHSERTTQFEILLGGGDSLKVDWSRESTRWSLCLRTADAMTFDLFDRSTTSLSQALEAGFASPVLVQVVRE